MTININQLSQEMRQILAAFSEEIGDIIDEACSGTAKETVKELKRTSPKQSGKYAASWKVKKNAKGSYIIYNKEHYRLTHLLEYGHALKGGGRARAYKHIGPAEEKAIERLLNQLEGAVMIKKIKAMLEETGFPVIYSHYKEPPELPYICFYRDQGNSVGSDYGNELLNESYMIELYSGHKDIEAEEKIIEILTSYGLSYVTNEMYIDSEEMYLCTFEIEIYYKRKWATCRKKG